MTITAEQLLQHSQWAHSLARHLVGDAAEAEDIVQDAWVAALQGPPPKGALRPWLGGVIRNLALMGHRTAGRRRVRERSVAKPEALPATDELVGRAEAQRMLVDAVLALAEPYRSVVILRYFENHSSAEIARDRGIAAGTVRSQLHEGLAKLRMLLDSKCGGERSAWCVALLPLARADLMATAATTAATAATTTATTTGGISSQALQGLLLMNTTKVAAGLAAVAILLAVIFMVVPTRPADTTGSSTEVAQLPSPPEMPVADLGEDPVKSTSAIAQRHEMPPSFDAAVDVFNVRARFVDKRGEPIQNVRLVVSGLSFSIGSHAALSDVKGMATLTIRQAPPAIDNSDPNDAGKYRVGGRASCPGWANEFRQGIMTEGEVLDFGDIQLVAGGSIRGKALFASGQPVLGARVSALSGRGATGRASAIADANGAFVLEGVLAGLVKVYANADEGTRGMSERIRVRPGQTTSDVVVVVARDKVAREDRIHGVVQDSTGRPVPQGGVQVWCEAWSPFRSGGATADAKGLFATKARARVAHQALAFDPKNRWRVAYEPKLNPGVFKKFRLQEPGQMRIVVRDSQGRSVKHASVLVSHAGRPAYVFTYGEQITIDGERQIPMPPIPFVIAIWAKGYLSKQLGPFDPKAMPKRIPTFTCELARAFSVSGVVSAHGVPVPGALVRLHLPASQRITKQGFPIFVDPRPPVRGKTDAQGRYRFWLQVGVPFHLLVTAKGYALAHSGPHPASRVADPAGIPIALSAGGVIEGRILGGPKGRGARAVVAISRGDGVIRSLRVDKDGHYRFAHVTPGRWLVRKIAREILGSQAKVRTLAGQPYAETPWNVQVFEGRTTQFNLGLEPRGGCDLAGSLRLGKVVVDGWRVQLKPIDGVNEGVLHTRIGSDGRFRLRVAAKGRYSLHIGGKQDRVFLYLETIVELKPGHNGWRFDHEMAEVTIKSTIKDTQGDNQRSRPTAFRWQEGDVVFMSPIRLGPDGTAKNPMPKGKLDVVQDESRSRKDPMTWPILKSFHLKTDLTITLPK